MISNKNRWAITFIYGILGVYLAFMIIDDYFQNRTPGYESMMLFISISLLVIGLYFICAGYFDVIFCRKFKYRSDYKYINAKDGEEMDMLRCIKTITMHPIKNIEYNDVEKIAKVYFYWKIF